MGKVDVRLLLKSALFGSCADDRLPTPGYLHNLTDE
jgi:hypothetical protein